MTKLPTITEIKFQKANLKQKSLYGFVSFLYDGRLALKDIAVHELREPQNGLKFRLVYPKNMTEKVLFHPIDKATQEHIDREVNKYVETVTNERQVRNEPRMDAGDGQRS